MVATSLTATARTRTIAVLGSGETRVGQEFFEATTRFIRFRFATDDEVQRILNDQLVRLGPALHELSTR